MGRRVPQYAQAKIINNNDNEYNKGNNTASTKRKKKLCEEKHIYEIKSSA